MIDAANTQKRDLWPAIIAILFSVVATMLALSGLLMDDEALLAWLGVKSFLNDPIAMVFFQKFHPSSALLLALPTLISWHAYLMANTVMAGLTIFFLGKSSNLLGANGIITALVLALSPPFIVSAITGQSNTSAMFLFALALWLALKGHRARILAGLLLGFALWTRYEFAFLFAGLAFFIAFAQRDLKAALFTLVWPALYLSAGAAWHKDLLWFLHFPPAVPDLIPGTLDFSVEKMGFDTKTAYSFFAAMAMVTPAWLLGLIGFFKCGDKQIACLGLGQLLTLLAMVVLPLSGHLFNFEFSDRYLMVLLPGIALGASLIGARSSKYLAPFLIVAGVMLGIALRQHHPSWLLLALPFGLASVVPLIPVAKIRTTVILIVILVVSGLLLTDQSSFKLPSLNVKRMELANKVVAHQKPGAAIYTNAHLLAYTLASPNAPSQVNFLAGYDMIYEPFVLTNHVNNQNKRWVNAVENNFYGNILWPCLAGKRPLNAGDLLVLSNDKRAEVIYPIEIWKQDSEMIERVGGFEIWEVKQDIQASVMPELPPWLPPAVVSTMCP
ncbi:MAG TPA: hypothetical protein P5317_04155 [Myxococcota bacterium]|nr:hypothetical protein [Myxococcota bacterium]HRR74504.1 hypothetical protein [Myxococcota bacterium]HRV17190.1 hypothetical protein [Myxococcota bacterium]